MLCHEKDHFYTRCDGLLPDFLTAIGHCIELLADLLFPDSTHHSSPPLPDPTFLSETSLVEPVPDNTSIPLSNWDGLLAAELILRPNNDHRILDLNTNYGRTRMASAIRSMDFIDSHDALSMAQSLDEYIEGPLPDAPKMSITEMKAACEKANSSLVTSSPKVSKTIIAGESGNIITYDFTSNRYILNSASPPIPPPSDTESLKYISWNCNSWDFQKAHNIASLAKLNSVDVILITDTHIDSYRALSAVKSFAKILQK